MSDRRSLRSKLEAMAARGTPHEAEVARRKLAAMGPDPDPPPVSSWTFTATSTSSSTQPRPGTWYVRDVFNPYDPLDQWSEYEFRGANGERIVIRGHFRAQP